MARILTSLSVALLVAPAWGQVPEMKSADQKKLVKGVGEWVTAELEQDIEGRLDGRDEIQETLDGLAKKYPGVEVYRYLDAWTEALASRGGKFPRARTGKLAMEDTPFGFPAHYWVPDEYDPKDAGAPVVLWLRDAALDEDTVEAIPAEVRATHVVMAVPVPAGTTAADVMPVRMPFLGRLVWLSKQLRIDRNRVYVIADSDHAELAARLCALAPHVVAGIAVVGETGEQPAGNMALFGAQTTDSLDQAWAWLAEAPLRQAYPTALDIELLSPRFGRVFWVQAMSFDTEIEGKPARLKVTADRASNRIEIEAENVYQIDLFLNDQIVDLSKPIVVVRNGQELEISTTPGFMNVLQFFSASLYDSGMVFPAKYTGIDIPPKE